MNHKVIVLGIVLLILGMALVGVMALGIWLFGLPTRISVEAEAIQAASTEIATIAQQGVAARLATIVPDLAKCQGVLRDIFADSKGQYTLAIKNAFNANDPRFASKGMNSPIGNREAIVSVTFSNGAVVELYFYNGTPEGCKIVAMP
jgi:hypothetical protein